MKENPHFFYMLWVIVKYWAIEKSRTNIRCWFGHNYKDTESPTIKKCKRCGLSTLIIYAIYEDE